MISPIRRHVLLVEMLSLQTMLLEGRFEFLQQKFGPLMVSALANEMMIIPATIAGHLDLAKPIGRCNATELGDAVFNYVFTVDPDPVKKNAQWLLTVLLRKNNPMPLEDLEYATETLTNFAEMKKTGGLPKKTDINQFKSLSELNATMRGEQQTASTALATEEQSMLKQATVLYDGPDYRVLSPLTKMAACYFGRDTAWCTAWGDHLALGLSQQGRYPTRSNLFDNYVAQGPLYIVLDKAAQKMWQFSFGAGQFMDVDDRSINIDQFMTKHPKINQIFEKIDGEPLDKIMDFPVYAAGKGFVIKSRSGPTGKIYLTIEIGDDNVLTKVTGRWAADFSHNNINEKASHELASFLTKHQITGDPLGEEQMGLYYRDGWGLFNEVAEMLFDVDLHMVWVQVQTHTVRELQLLSGNMDYVVGTLSLADGELTMNVNDAAYASSSGVRKPKHQTSTTWNLTPEVSHAIVELLLRDDSIKKWNTYRPSNLVLEDATRLANAKPFLSDIPTAFKVHGASDAVKDLIIDWCNEEDLTYERKGDSWIKNYLVIERFKDIPNMIDELGNDGAKWFQKTLNGDSDLDFGNSSADRSQRESFIESLTPGTLKRLGEYLLATYPDEAADIDDYNPSSASDVNELAELVDDDDLTSAADWAAQDGQRVGAENEMSEMYKRAIASNHHILIFNDDGSISADFRWDASCAFVIAIGDLVEFIDNEGLNDAGYTINHEGWAETFEAKVELEEPHYGFTEYDDEAADERYEELVLEFLPDHAINAHRP